MNSDIENLKKLRSFHNGSYAKSLDLAIKAKYEANRSKMKGEKE